MPITQYLQSDFTNITPLVETYTNAGPNLGTPPNLNTTGIIAAAFGPFNSAQEFAAPQAAATVLITFDLDHSTPSTPIPAAARITKITFQQQVSVAQINADISAVFTQSGSGNIGHTRTDGIMSLGLFSLDRFNPPPNTDDWITNLSTPFLPINITDTDISPDGASESSSSTPSNPILAQVIYDITLNPNGDFPLGYMDFATFSSKFTNCYVTYNFSSSAAARWFAAFNPADHIDGTYSNGLSITAANFLIEVEWELPVVTTWEVTPATLTLPDNEITISRPEADSDQNIEKVFIDDIEITPDDPWVVLWTDTEIIIHLPPDGTDDPRVDVEFAGVQFSGRVPLITLAINTADLSGIYEFDITAHHDTLYDRTAVPTTQNVKIPAPFLVTYFAGDEEFNVMHFAGTRVRATGQGIIHQVLQSYDYMRTIQFGDETLRTSNNISEFSLTDFVEQKASLRIYMDTYDDYMNVSNIIMFAKPLYTGYPK